ncbi:MAG: 1-acyl-sn-glycerol-3-phosphate acyltransferase [Lachnospiraceae bacterium]|nr:1-acyl-sn-glycerol-3-phosphate acyltransferase [Lachnospiraceae bacterium]
MIRLIFTLLYAVIYLIFSLVAYLFVWIVGHFDMEKKNRLSLVIAQIFFKGALFFSGVHVNVIGEEHIPTDHAVLFVGNHRGFFDIIVAYTLVKDLCGFVAKKEMKKVPIVSAWMKNLHCLFLDRENIKEGLKTILNGIEQVKNGISVWIYPEGTRNKESDTELPLLPFKEGSMKIAEKSGCPVIPVAMIHTADVLEKHMPWIRSQTVTVWFGDPIDLSVLSKEERKKSGAYVQHIIEEMLTKMLAEET